MNEIEKYIRKIRRAFPVYGTNERKFISDMKDSVIEYFNNNATAAISYEGLLREFGEPKTVAMTYFENISNEEYYFLMKRVRFIRLSVLTIFLSIIITLLIMLAYWISAYNKAMENTVTSVDYEISEVINEKSTEIVCFYDNADCYVQPRGVC